VHGIANITLEPAQEPYLMELCCSDNWKLIIQLAGNGGEGCPMV
jgi:hypothetical protein